MANDRFADLESPFLDPEVLPVRPPTETESLDETDGSQSVAELEAVSDRGQAADEIDEEADQQALLEAWFSDPEAAETELVVDEAETAADEVEEFAADTGGHFYQDFEGIEKLDDTAQERSEVRESVDEEPEQPVQWGEEEADEEAGEGQDEESLLERGELEIDGELEDEEVRPQPGRGGPTTATATVTVLLDEPLEADDKYRLVSDDGKSNTLSAKDAKPLVDGVRLLSFTGIDPKKQYKLTHIRKTGAERVILPMGPFTGLTKAGKRAPQAKNTYVTVSSQVPKKLPDVHRTDRPVDPILVATSPVLVDLAADDPRL
jgi:hypothetical protein